MRVLFTTTGGEGHVGPLLPFARALRRAGDDVLVAVRRGNAGGAAAAGLPVWDLDDPDESARAAIFASLAGLTDDEANERVAGELFAGLYARSALPGIVAAIETWRPDVLVHESAELAGPLPANVHVERWVPQADAGRDRAAHRPEAAVLPHAAAIVCHAPLVVLPQFADQRYNAERIEAMGAGVALPSGLEGIGGLAAAVERVLGDPAYAAATAPVVAEARALPPVDAAVAVLRDLAATGAVAAA